MSGKGRWALARLYGLRLRGRLCNRFCHRDGERSAGERLSRTRARGCGGPRLLLLLGDSLLSLQVKTVFGRMTLQRYDLAAMTTPIASTTHALVDGQAPATAAGAGTLSTGRSA